MILYAIFTVLLFWHVTMIINFHEFTVWDSKIFYNVKELGEVDISEFMQDLTFAFKFKDSPVDMVDNEYVYINFVYQIKQDNGE